MDRVTFDTVCYPPGYQRPLSLWERSCVILSKE